MIIRINLNPARKSKSQSNSAMIAVVATLVMAVVTIGIFMMISSNLDDETRKVQAQVDQVNQQINQIKSRIADNQKIMKKKAELEKRQQMLVDLASIRRGPQYVLNEFSRVLSNPRDVVARKEASENGWLLAWEPDNIMIKSFKALDKGKIEIVGTARTMDDIYEFWTRMKTSRMFRKVVLVEIKGSQSGSEQVQEFVFDMDANFNYRTKEGLMLIESLNEESNEENAPVKNETGGTAPKAN